MLLFEPMWFRSWNSQHHGQTIHPTENLVSMNLLQISCVITWNQKKISLQPQKKDLCFHALEKGKQKYFLMEIFCWIKPKSKSTIWAQSIKKPMLDIRLKVQ